MVNMLSVNTSELRRFGFFKTTVMARNYVCIGLVHECAFYDYYCCVFIYLNIP